MGFLSKVRANTHVAFKLETEHALVEDLTRISANMGVVWLIIYDEVFRKSRFQESRHLNFIHRETNRISE